MDTGQPLATHLASDVTILTSLSLVRCVSKLWTFFSLPKVVGVYWRLVVRSFDLQKKQGLGGIEPPSLACLHSWSDRPLLYLEFRGEGGRGFTIKL